MNARPVLVTLLAVLAACVLVTALRTRAPRLAGPPFEAPARPAEGMPPAAALLFGARLDLNQASAADLEALPGIGPARAAAIVRLRTDRGCLSSADELLDVPGLGRATLERLAPFVDPGRGPRRARSQPGCRPLMLPR